MKLRLLSWNVNGIRAVEKKGFLEWLKKEKPFSVSLQETKARAEQLSPELRQPDSYYAFWSRPERKGYSGVATFSSEHPMSITYDFGNEIFDREGRVVATEYAFFILINVYFPNGRSGPERLKYKLDFYKAFLAFMDRLKKERKKPLILCGDMNTAHKEIDLARPKENEDVSGFLPIERAWIDGLVSWGMKDAFRLFHKGPGHYTWWDLKSRARERNVGWRLDYFFVDREIESHVVDASIHDDVFGSDHCPVGIVLEVS